MPRVARGASVVVPPTKTARVSRLRPRWSARDRTIQKLEKIRRRRWKKASGYHRQARVENAFFRYKLIIADSLRARSPAGQGTEAVLACQHPQSDDSARQARVVGHREVTRLCVGIVRGARHGSHVQGGSAWAGLWLAPIHAPTPSSAATSWRTRSCSSRG